MGREIRVVCVLHLLLAGCVHEETRCSHLVWLDGFQDAECEFVDPPVKVAAQTVALEGEPAVELGTTHEQLWAPLTNGGELDVQFSSQHSAETIGFSVRTVGIGLRPFMECTVAGPRRGLISSVRVRPIAPLQPDGTHMFPFQMIVGPGRIGLEVDLRCEVWNKAGARASTEVSVTLVSG